MSSNLPAILGGTPVRDYSFRTTPEVGKPEVDFVSAQILTADWEPDSVRGGMPVTRGLIPPQNVAESLGVEQAAAAAELAELQAPGQRAFVIPNNNGTQAIKLALAALAKWAPTLGLREFKVGSEVLVPALTWQATAGAVLRRNMVPVLVDVLPGTLCMDPAAMHAAITDRTVAAIPVHLYDRMAEMAEILKITTPLGIAVIEDCAHAQGARYLGQGAGTIGEVGSFSGQGSKSLACQEGGFLITLVAELADQLCSAITCGREVGVSKRLQSDNDRMPGAIAALLRSQLRRFPEQNALRARTLEVFDSMVRTELGSLGLRVSDAQPNVEVTPTYKKVVRIDLGEWGGVSLGQWRAAMEAELDCEIATVYKPLIDSPVYDPHSDPALRINADYWRRIDPKGYKAPVAEDAFATTVAIEHAAFLDARFPERFAVAAQKVKDHSRRIASEVAPLT